MTVNPTQVISAGGVIYRFNSNKAFEIYLCKHQINGYVLPKGKQELKETIAQTAIREVFEETGYQLIPNKLLGKISYNFILEGKNVEKEVYFFAFKYNDEEQDLDKLKDEINIKKGKWVLLDQVDKIISHKSEAEICKKLHF